MAKVKSEVRPGWAKFCGWLLRRMGWKTIGGPMKEPKAIVLGVPHTTLLDFLVCYLFYTQFGKVAHIMVRKEFFKWPLGPILRACGAVPVDTKSATGTVKSLIEQMESVPEFHLALAPEGTRKPVKRWKTGFHFIARKANIPVYLCYFDWGTRRIGNAGKVELTDDAAADMKRIQQIYEDMHLTGRHPEKYITH